ncbi:MAG: hypothetical protein JNK60_13085 [Acidobacteria bacterium]|nr:hypothetical protein [Acidobacteriota bacterium]
MSIERERSNEMIRRYAGPKATLLSVLLASGLPALSQAVPAGNVFNPNISVVGNGLAVMGRNDVDAEPSIQLREVELGLQATVDPYAKAEFYLSYGSAENQVAVEEGFITFLSLPLDLVVKAGKLKGAFGKLNTEHLHTRLFADVPLPMTNLLGSDDGIEDAGISVSRILPAPAGVFLEGTAQLFRGTTENLFEAHSRSDVQPLFHLKGYGDLSESANLEVGGSFTRANNLEGPGYRTSLTGVDATFRWKPLRQSRYRSLLVRAEWFLSERETPAGTVRADGYYAFAEVQVARRWFAGFRHDESDHADQASLRDRGSSLLLTFRPSEFSQLRAQARSIRYEREGLGKSTANEVLLQLQFSIGAHGSHAF